MRQVNDKVFVVADNFGSEGVIVEVREEGGEPPSHYKVKTAHDEFWAFDFEISDATPAPYDSTADTREHIAKVQARIQECTNNLTVRASRHDMSKLVEPEKSAYDNLMRFKSSHDMVYGSEDYAEGLKILGPALDHHYKNNSHHPQYFENGVNGMSLLDILEMLCDWKAAGERYKDGNIADSLAHNRERFGLSDQLFAILENTVRELGWSSAPTRDGRGGET